MKFIFLIALFACIFCGFYDEYGCKITGSSKKCCWFNYHSCCKPAEGKRTCFEKRTLCCKRRVYSMEDGEYVYLYSGGSDSDEYINRLV